VCLRSNRLLLLLLLLPQAGTWYMDRKNEVPEGKRPYYVLPVVHYHKGYLATSFNGRHQQLQAVTCTACMYAIEWLWPYVYETAREGLFRLFVLPHIYAIYVTAAQPQRVVAGQGCIGLNA
jgi:hypothetical protein